MKAAVTVAVLLGCFFLFTQDGAGSRPAGVAPAPRLEGPLVVLTGNEHGFIRPCGCSKPALGGIHRRAHALAELRKAESKTAAVSLGDFINESNRQQELKLEAFLFGLTEMEYAAFVPGAGDP